jgi:hypothetical protein|tara:strand:- start:497 stop:673 length:177 start_codon:yes stop_codon:yes gene_type:complete
MNSSTVLRELKDLRDTWKRQSFMLSNEQQKRYDELIAMRRARVKEMYDNDLVYKSAAK